MPRCSTTRPTPRTRSRCGPPTAPASTDQTFTIAVTDVAPTTPTDSDGATGGSVSEGAADGDRGRHHGGATDVHGGTVTYSLIDDAGGRFAINASTGVVTVANAALLDYETNTSHQITVRASDGTASTDQTFTIAVTNVAPIDADRHRRRDRRLGLGRRRQRRRGRHHGGATDVHGGTVTYSLIDNAGGRFAIDASTGVVTVANAALLDYETNTSHQITVRASDGTGQHRPDLHHRGDRRRPDDADRHATARPAARSRKAPSTAPRSASRPPRPTSMAAR